MGPSSGATTDPSLGPPTWRPDHAFHGISLSLRILDSESLRQVCSPPCSEPTPYRPHEAYRSNSIHRLRLTKGRRRWLTDTGSDTRTEPPSSICGCPGDLVPTDPPPAIEFYRTALPPLHLLGKTDGRPHRVVLKITEVAQVAAGPGRENPPHLWTCAASWRCEGLPDNMVVTIGTARARPE
jgi:hypothetical protein